MPLKKDHAQLVNPQIADSTELSVAGEATRRILRTDVFQLLQGTQRRFDKSILFLIPLDGGDQITGVAESLAEGIPKNLSLHQKFASEGDCTLAMTI